MKKNKPIQLSIPQPCSEDWSKMTPQEQGRFCDACQKCVVDFTGFNDHQLYDYIQAHQEEKICGHFRNTQLNRTLQLPPQPHSRLYRIAIAVGLTLAIVSTTEIHSFAKAPLVEYSFLDKPQEDSTTNNSDITIIKGKVVDEHGEPINNIIFAEINKGSNFISICEVDTKGNYTLKEPLTKGEYKLLFWSDDSYLPVEKNFIVDDKREIIINTIMKPNPNFKSVTQRVITGEVSFDDSTHIHLPPPPVIPTNKFIPPKKNDK